jgi:outer membrane receptor for ferrienterochelin and colicin
MPSGVPIVVSLVASAFQATPPEQGNDSPSNEEIVVTGERVKRSLKDTPSNVDVISQSEIEAQSADRVEQVLALIPNVQLGNGSEGPARRFPPSWVATGRPLSTLATIRCHAGACECLH